MVRIRYILEVKKGDSYNCTNIERAIGKITDDNFDFKKHYKLTLIIE